MDDEDNILQNAAECNAETAGEASWDAEDEEEFVITALGASEKEELYKTVPYCGKWQRTNGLHVAKPQLTKRAYAHKRELGLFNLFLNSSYLNCVRAWTSKELLERGKRTKPLRMDELLAYLGVELAISVHRLNRLRDYWCNTDLLGIPFCKKVMGRDTFLNIRAAIRTYATYDPDIAALDPLWHSRSIFEHFARNSAGSRRPSGSQFFGREHSKV